MKGREVLAEAMRRAGMNEEFIRLAINRMDMEMPSMANEDIAAESVEKLIETIISGHQKIVNTISPDEVHQIYDKFKTDLSSDN